MLREAETQTASLGAWKYARVSYKHGHVCTACQRVHMEAAKKWACLGMSLIGKRHFRGALVATPGVSQRVRTRRDELWGSKRAGKRGACVPQGRLHAYGGVAAPARDTEVATHTCVRCKVPAPCALHCTPT